MNMENVNPQERQICFCTLALGEKYCKFAMDLVQDLEKYSPDKQILILTDKPNFFQNQKNVLIFKHEPRTVYQYYDKIYVIEKALSLYESCVFLDSDVRIIDRVPQDLEVLPGITADSCYSIYKLYNNMYKKGETADRNWQLISTVANKLNINLDDVKFVWEYLFFIKKSSQTEEFINLWRKIGSFYELNGRFGGEGESMGLAAAKLNIPVNYDYAKQIPFFKKRVEVHKISQGKAKREDKLPYLERYYQLKYPQKHIVYKALDRVQGKVGVFIRSLRLRLNTLRDFDFYYR